MSHTTPNLKNRKSFLYTISLCLLFIITNVSAFSQFNGGVINTDNFYTEVPFEYVQDKIVIHASMNGVEGRYLLDTGAMCILFKDSTEQQFANSQEMKIGDANGKKQQAQTVVMPWIQVGELRYENIPALYIEMFDGPFKCLGYKGIIGSNLLRFGAFKIDWSAQKIIIADSYEALGGEFENSSKLRVNKQQSSPFVKVKVNGKSIKWVLLDTGSGDSFSLYDKSAQWLDKKNAIKAPAYVSSGTNSHGAWGAGQHQTRIYNNVELAIGHVNFNNSIIETSAGKSKIGMKALGLGDFIIDYQQKRFFFDLNKTKQAWTIESFGVDLIMENDRFIVNGIWSGSEAEKQGIEKGDVLEEVAGMRFSEISSCDVFLSLKDITKDKNQLAFYFRKPNEEQAKKYTLSRIRF